MNEELKKTASSKEGDETLVRAFQSGDKAAFDKLVIKHKDRLFNTIYWFLGDYEEANDCTQETFIKLFRSLKTFRFESAFSTWLYRIAINTSKNRLKSSAYRWKKKTVPIEKTEGSKSGNPSFEITNESPSPVVEFERKERSGLIKAAINSLSEEHNRVIVLRDIQGMSYEEIADITSLNLGTIKSRIARGRLELRNNLKGRI
jgi:RNA polymerase sigma-70 factor (ECF subfamily)